MLDILIKNGNVIDGSSRGRYEADIAIKKGKIKVISQKINADAKTVINAQNLIVAPGFIDTHTHAELDALNNPTEKTKLRQGITTAVIGQDGLSVAPIDEKNKQRMIARLNGLLGPSNVKWAWNTLGEYLSVLDSIKPGVNYMMLAPLGGIRAIAMGWDDRTASNKELASMKEILIQSLEDGACGLSAGLIYPPGMYTKRHELIELCKITGEFGGSFVVHMRNEGDYIIDAINEVIDICLEANCPLHISHLKVAGKRNWHNAEKILSIIEEANERLKITFDQYPYIAGNTVLDAVIPPKFHSGGTEKMLKRLQDSTVRDEIKKIQNNITREKWDNWVDYCGWDGIFINSVKYENNRFCEGKSIKEISEILKKSPLDTVCDLLIAEEGSVTMTEFYGCEENVATFMRSDLMMLCSDGIVGSKPHPRLTGSFPRFLGRYVRCKKVLTLEDAIKKITSWPAQYLGLTDRGLIKEGTIADIVIFDSNSIIDNGTFSDPLQNPSGIHYVVVGGKIAVFDKKPTGLRNGKVIRLRKK